MTKNESERTQGRKLCSAMRAEIVKVAARGQNWSGTYQVEDGEISVSSAYGWSKEPLRRRKPEAAAEKLLIDQVTAWAKRRMG